MSIRLARTIAILWVVAFTLTASAGVAWAFVDEWRVRVSRPNGTPTNTVSYVQHGQTLFMPPDVAKWQSRSISTFKPLMISLLALTVLVSISSRQSDAIGRRWWHGRK